MIPQNPRPDGTAPEYLQGSVERVTFHSPESGFCVLRVKVRSQRELVTVVGSAATITPGEYIECAGAWTNDRQHGLQFKTQHLRVVPPTTLEGYFCTTPKKEHFGRCAKILNISEATVSRIVANARQQNETSV
jgi:hypothetical protein